MYFLDYASYLPWSLRVTFI